MNTKVIVSVSIAVVATFFLSTIMFDLLSDELQAFAGKTLNKDDVAQTMQIKMMFQGGNKQEVYDSFSRIGFVRGSNEFLLESLPSKDKKSFYDFVAQSLNSPNSKFVDVEIAIFSGDNTLIETLKYQKCTIDSYFVHVNDSKGKFNFLDDGTSKMEIREVTTFRCINFSIKV